MGKRKNYFSSSQRWSIWSIYGMKCFKCSKPIDFDECEIGRIIPDSLSKIAIASLVKDYALGNDFSVNDYGNLVPTCYPCNKKGKSSAAFRPSPAIPGWFKVIQLKSPLVEAKVRQIDGDQSAESFLKVLVEKLERGALSPEDLERLKQFLESVEGKPKGTIELRLNESTRVFFSEEGLRLQPVSEIRYQKFVEGMVESGDWKRKSAEVIREGPTFGEGRRRPGGGGA